MTLVDFFENFANGLKNGKITTEEGRWFADAVFNLVLAKEVENGRTGNNAPRAPAAKVQRGSDGEGVRAEKPDPKRAGRRPYQGKAGQRARIEQPTPDEEGD